MANSVRRNRTRRTPCPLTRLSETNGNRKLQCYAVVDGHLQKLVDETVDLDLLKLPESRDGAWPVEVLLLNVVFQTIVTAARVGFKVKSGLNTHVVSRSWIATGFVRFEEFKVYYVHIIFLFYPTSLIVFGFLCSSTRRTTTS